MPKAPDKRREFTTLLKVVETLRGPDGCPWDKEQTHASLTRFAIEEAHELAEAIDQLDQNKNSLESVKSELGDVLLQVVLHAEIARQNGTFEMADVIETLNEKMIRRHPHVFGDVSAKTSQEVLQNWGEIKAKEKGTAPGKPLCFDIPAGLPSLLRAQKIGEKTSKVDFDFENAAGCWDKVREELSEVEAALTQEEKLSELGDVLFSLAQWARHSGLDAEQALRQSNARFEKRFTFAQNRAVEQGRVWLDLAPDEKEELWREAKRAEAQD